MSKCKCWQPAIDPFGKKCHMCIYADFARCNCDGLRYKCDFFPEVREEGIQDKIDNIKGGYIPRRNLVSKLVEVAAQNNTELPVWVWNVINSMDTEKHINKKGNKNAKN